jgi:hypothetical protein
VKLIAPVCCLRCTTSPPQLRTAAQILSSYPTRVLFSLLPHSPSSLTPTNSNNNSPATLGYTALTMKISVILSAVSALASVASAAVFLGSDGNNTAAGWITPALDAVGLMLPSTCGVRLTDYRTLDSDGRRRKMLHTLLRSGTALWMRLPASIIDIGWRPLSKSGLMRLGSLAPLMHCGWGKPTLYHTHTG